MVRQSQDQLNGIALGCKRVNCEFMTFANTLAALKALPPHPAYPPNQENQSTDPPLANSTEQMHYKYRLARKCPSKAAGPIKDSY